MLEGILGLVGVVLGSAGMLWYRLGKLTATVKHQGEDIKEIKRLVIDGNSNPGRRRSKK
jgi:hypothetical protein